LTCCAHAQDLHFIKKSDTLNVKRKNAILITESVLTGGTLLALNELWYKKYERAAFHFKNDHSDWQQMDKAGHFMTAYSIGKIGMDVLNWGGISKKNQLIYGATLGFTFLSAVEVLDGFSKEWGASISDIMANAAGTGLFVGQELVWKEQRIIVKYSFHQTDFAKQRPNTLGKNFLEQSLKDYNGQTYWLSANIWSFYKKSTVPKWLNLALGYGAEGMLYGENKTTNPIPQDPYRQFYLSLDVDLSKINTNSKFLKSIFSVVNFIKIPSPTIEINTKGQLKFHYLYF
jgi:uncharacterized protein YfiM (DUF2279 family)